MILSYNNIIGNKVRSSSYIVKKSDLEIRKLINQFLFQIKDKPKICFMDLDFLNSKSRNEDSKKYNKILRLGIRSNGPNFKSNNNIEFSFEVNLNYYLVCDMHLIYIFERVFFEILKDFQPDFVFLYFPYSFQNYKESDANVVLTGDCIL